jgi:8-oxo-dGTP pyrophosphatase MutT (NUDIX family)
VLTSEFANIKVRIKELLENGLPGDKAHRLMLPNGRELYPAADNLSIQSSVLILLFPDNGTINTCLIRRPPSMRHHGGQIAFPGGRSEPSDKDLVQTALRESYEEIGIDYTQVEIIGRLTPLYVQVSNFTINPFIGWSETLPEFKIDNREVDEIFIVPVGNFLHPATIQLKEVSTMNGTLKVPGFFINQLFIWGATAMIISEFNGIISSLPDILRFPNR